MKLRDYSHLEVIVKARTKVLALDGFFVSFNIITGEINNHLIVETSTRKSQDRFQII